MTRFLTLLTVLAAALLAAAPASAQQCNAPPGTAAVDQYCENVPSASGNGGGSNGSQGGSNPSQATVRQIRQAGQSGKELATFLGDDEAASTRAKPERSKRSSGHKKQQQADEPAGATPRQPSSNPLGAVQSAVNSGSTVGDGFVWILLAIAVLIAGIAWLRVRRRSSS